MGFGIFGYALAFAGQFVLAVSGILNLPDDFASFAGLFIGGIAAALQKAWNISERAAALGVVIPDASTPGVPNVPSAPTDPTDIGAIT